MSTEKYKQSASETQPLAEIISFATQGRLNTDPASKARAFVDLTLYFSPGGSLTVHGITVLHDAGKDPRVLLPSRKGDNRYFPIVSDSGEIHRLIERRVLDEYERLKGLGE